MENRRQWLAGQARRELLGQYFLSPDIADIVVYAFLCKMNANVIVYRHSPDVQADL